MGKVCRGPWSRSAGWLVVLNERHQKVTAEVDKQKQRRGRRMFQGRIWFGLVLDGQRVRR